MERGPTRRAEMLERLAATADVEHLPVTSLTRLATSLAIFGRRETAIALLRRAQASHRDNFWVNADLGRELMASNRPEEAVRFYAVAAGVRPQSPLALSGLGRAILLSGQPAEAADLFGVDPAPPRRPARTRYVGSALLALGESSEAHAVEAKGGSQRTGSFGIRSRWPSRIAATGTLPSASRKRPSVCSLRWAWRTRRLLTPCNRPVGSKRRWPSSRGPRLDPRISASHLFLGRAFIEAGKPHAALGARPDRARSAADPFITPGMLASRAENLIALEPRLPAVMNACEAPANAEEAASFARLAFAQTGPRPRCASGPRRSPRPLILRPIWSP